jgi:hypothetical protein
MRDSSFTNKAKGTKATVEFRFTRRRDDTDTAFETGMFKYTLIDKSGAKTTSYRPFEELLVKKNGKWVALMERQLDAATQADWDKLAK